MLLADLRRWWWREVKRYRYELCDDCGDPVGHRAFGIVADDDGLSPTTYWFADNELWNDVMGSEVGVVCPSCFTRRAIEAGHHVGWRCGLVGEVEQ